MEIFSQTLSKIGDRLHIHAEFLNTLSLLEYIGTRKIVKSQVDRELTEELLGHIAEEIRHAQILKHLALKLSNEKLQTYRDEHLLCGSQGRSYMQTVDHAAENELSQKHSWMNYLLTTMVVEERAAQVYPIYNAYLTQLGFSNKLTSIVRDEDKHLQIVLNHLRELEPRIDEIMNRLRIIETDSFTLFMNSIQATL